MIQNDDGFVRRVPPDRYAKIVRTQSDHARSRRPRWHIPFREEQSRIEGLSSTCEQLILSVARPTHRYFDCIGMADETDLRCPSFSLDDLSDEDWPVHGVRSGNESSIRRPTERQLRTRHVVSAAHLSRRKKVDFGELANGRSTLWTKVQSSEFQILTVLSSDSLSAEDV
jgi:hypothetical protein